MPQVPYTPYPTITPTAPGTREVGIGTPPAAFGELQAQALRGMGQQIEQSGGQLGETALYIQGMKNETWAKDEFVNQSAKLGQIESDFYSKKGKNAVAAQDQYQEDVKSLYEGAIANAPNSQAQKFLSDALARRVSYSIVDGQRHAGEQNLQYMTEVSTARVAQAVADSESHPWDDRLFGDGLKVIESEAKAQAEQKGAGPEAAKVNVERWTSLAWMHRLNAIAFNNPDAAQQLFDANKDKITGVSAEGVAYADQIQRNIQERQNKVGVAAAAHDLMFGGDYYKRLDAQEGRTKSPTSSAFGYGQFVKGTWDTVRSTHPELDLPSFATATTADRMRATVAFTQDNQKKLADANIAPSMGNTYMAHFLGAEGAIRFIRGMEDNPDQPVTNLVNAESLRANRTIFFNRDGTPRTAAQVYALQTAKFRGPGQMSADSGPEYEEQLLNAGREYARTYHGDNPEFEERLTSRLRSDFSAYSNSYKREEYGTYVDLLGAVNGSGGGPKATNMDAIHNNPQLEQRWQSLASTASGRAHQQYIEKTIENNFKHGSLDPDQQTGLFNNVMGLAIKAETDMDARDQFSHMDLGTLSGQLDKGLIDKIYAEQQHIQRVWQGKGEQLDRNNRLAGAMSFLQHTLDSYGIRPSKTDQAANDLYNTFTGAMYQKITELERQTGKPVTDQAQIQGLAGPILQQMADTRAGWNPNRWLFANPSPRAFQPPADIAAKIVENFKALPEAQGAAPSAFQLGQIYQNILANPALRKKYGIE